MYMQQFVGCCEGSLETHRPWGYSFLLPVYLTLPTKQASTCCTHNTEHEIIQSSHCGVLTAINCTYIPAYCAPKQTAKISRYTGHSPSKTTFTAFIAYCIFHTAYCINHSFCKSIFKFKIQLVDKYVQSHSVNKCFVLLQIFL